MKLRSMLVVATLAGVSFAQKGAAPAAAGPLEQAQIDAALERGVEFLVGSYRERMAKGRIGAQERSGQMALSLYALLKSGAAREDASVQRLLHELSKQRPDQTYDVACMALAAAAHERIDNRLWLEELAAQLVAWQEKGGDWGYPGAILDLSNTQYAALGLWAAARSGVPIESDVWKRMAQSVLKYATEDGGFGYTAGSKAGATGSMTAAGVGTLAIAESQLRLARALDAALEGEIAAARRRGVEWLGKRFTVETNPGSGGWHYYYLYGLERMGAFAAAPKLGPHDWYDAGARWLLARQDPKGSWTAGADLSETCFALLFLRRATSSEPRKRGPVSGERPQREGAPTAVTIAAEAAPEDRGATRLAIVDWDAGLLSSLERAGERGRGPRVARVEWIVDGQPTSVELGLPSQPADRSRFAVLPLFKSAGKHTAQAHVYALREDGAEERLESQTLEFEVTHALPEWMGARKLEKLGNFAPDTKPKARASSHARGAAAPFGEAYEAEFAADGNPRTAWLAAENDAKRELSIQYAKPRECARIVVRPAFLVALGPQALGRVTKLEVVINGKARHELVGTGDARQPFVIELAPTQSVKRIDVRILESSAGATNALVGVGEIELHAP
jgi:hypothetical protein